MRDVAATGNVIRRSRVGISVTNANEAGACLIANNLISQASDGAIRQMVHGVVLGPDLAKEPAAGGRIALAGNLALCGAVFTGGTRRRLRCAGDGGTSRPV